MTRDEAVKIWVDGQKGIVGDCIDRFVALGMLKLDEPKSAEEHAIGVLAGAFFQVEDSGHIYDGKYSMTCAGASRIIEKLRISGLKIVSK